MKIYFFLGILLLFSCQQDPKIKIKEYSFIGEPRLDLKILFHNNYVVLAKKIKKIEFKMNENKLHTQLDYVFSSNVQFKFDATIKSDSLIIYVKSWEFKKNKNKLEPRLLEISAISKFPINYVFYVSNDSLNYVLENVAWNLY